VCNEACIDFGRRHLRDDDVRGRAVLEVGSLDSNGSLRPFLEAMGPRTYLGVDIRSGPGVDEICPAEDLVERLGVERFDLLVSTELLEHVRDWRKVISNFKRLLTADGILLITTRSYGFPYHGSPGDYWRYEPEDLRAILADLTVDVLEPDPLAPGVFVRARKPREFEEVDLKAYRLYSMVAKRRVRDVTRIRIVALHLRRRVEAVMGRVLPSGVKAAIRRWIPEGPRTGEPRAPDR